MYELKTNTAVRIPVGPLVDPTDGKTAETALTVTGMSVEIFQMKNDGTAVVRAAFNPTASGGSNDMIHVTGDTTGTYDLELTAAQLNFLGNARIVFYDVDGFLVHYIDIVVVSATYFNFKYGAGAIAPTVGEIDTQLSSTHGAGAWGSAASSGDYQINFLTEQADHTPIADVDLTVRNSSDTATVTTAKTDTNGEASVALDAGTYKVRIKKNGSTFTTPQTLVVTDDDDVTYTGTEFSPTPPATGYQTLYGDALTVGTPTASGDTVAVYPAYNNLEVSDAIVSELEQTTTVQSDGSWQIQVLQGADVIVEFRQATSSNTYFRERIVVTADATKNFASYLD